MLCDRICKPLANISQLFLSASGFLYRFFFVDEASFRKELLIVSGQCRKDALTKFFVLSNIRFVSGGSSEMLMLRTSRCIGIKLFQSDGPRTLAVIASSLCSLSSRSESRLVSWGHSSSPNLGQIEIIPEMIWNSGPIYFRPRGGQRAGNLKEQRAALSGAAHYFRGPAIQEVSHGGPGN